MAGLQSQNISVASTKVSGPSLSERDVCVFCRRRATPSASDPHAPLFPFFSLVDCRHYACQPCALVHCDNAGRCISCPQCNCVSRLAQSGRRRNRSSSYDTTGAGGNDDAYRVFIDDGVSSVRSHRSATTRPLPHRSAIKGQNGSSKKRSSSVQFPPNPTTLIVDPENAISATNKQNNASAADGVNEGRRATSPLTQDAVAALPVDPSETRRQRVREQQQQRATAAAAQADKSVNLYAITAAPPKPLSATMSGRVAPMRRSKDRSHSQPVPRLPNTILEPKPVFPVPPPLVLHTIDEDEPATATTSDAAKEETTNDAGNDASSTRVSFSKTSMVMRNGELTAVRSPLDRAQLEECEAAETEERGVLDAVEEHARTKLRQYMEEAETTIHARRGLEGEFESTPLPSQREQALTDLSDQVSATSDDELSQRSSAHKFGSNSRRKHRTPHSSVLDGAGANGSAAAATAGVEGQKEQGELQLKAKTPGNAPSAARIVGVTASTVDTPSPMTATRPTRPSDVEESSQAKVNLDAVDTSKGQSLQQQQEERDAFARQSLEDREAFEREAVGQTEEAVRALYERNAEEWRSAFIAHALEDERHARAAVDIQRRKHRQLAQVQADEIAGRANAANEEADEWAWLISGARVDRVLAATEESERVQREYGELRYERFRQQFQQDVAELVQEEQRGRRAFEAYEDTTRDVLQRHCRVQRDAALAEEQQQRKDVAQKFAVRREAALQQRWQREREELDSDEVEGRAIVREEEREERRTANMVFVQGVAAVRRRELLANLACSALGEKEEAGAEHALATASADSKAAEGSSLHSKVPTVIAADDAQQQQADTARISAYQLEELRARQAQYEDEMRAAMQRLQEAERRVAEEAAIRARAEEERRVSQAESERLLQEAEQRAEQRIRDARDAAEQLMQAQLADVRDEAARRAEHAAVMHSLAEEEQRAILEAKLQAAERQLQEAQQRAAEEVQRTRDEAAAMAAAEVARAAREAQRREEEWQERVRAENLLRLAEQENEKADAIRRLSELEARATEAVRLAREEAARNAAAMEERIAEMERRQQMREAEVQQASQRVRNAQDNVRDFDSRSQSSLNTTPSRMERHVASPQQLSSQRSSRNASASIITPLRSERISPASASASAVLPASVSAGSRHTLQTPPLAPSPSQTSSLAPRVIPAQQQQQQQQKLSPSSSSAVPVPQSASTPPRVVLGAGVNTFRSSSPSAQPTSLSRQQAPLSSAASASGGGGWNAGFYNFDPAEVVRAAIREAVMEIVAAQQQAQSLRDQAEQHAELSERRFRERKSDQLQAAHEVAALASSRAQSERGDSPHTEQRPPRSRSGNHVESPFSHVRASNMSNNTPSLGYERAHGSRYEENLRSRSSTSSPAGAVSVPSATAAGPDFVISSGLSNTSSVYFDDQPYWATCEGRGNAMAAAAFTRGAPAQGQYRYDLFAHQQQQPMAASAAQPHRAASRVLFPTRHSHSDGAAANVVAGKNLRFGDYVPSLQLTQKGGGGGHTYNEPEPSKPASVTIEYSPPPPRRSTTRADTEGEQPCSVDAAPTAHAVAPTVQAGTVPITAGILPKPSRVCQRCYSSDTTSTCWRCGELICRQCGLQPGSARKLCCSAHLRAELLDYARKQQQQQQQASQQPLRGDQQVQTSLRTSTNASEGDNSVAEEFVDAPGRYDASTSTSQPSGPTSMIPPSAYYLPVPPSSPPQQQPQQYYFDHPGLYANPVSVAAMTAGEPIAAYPSGNPRMPYAYPNLYPPQSMPPQWSWQTLPSRQQAAGSFGEAGFVHLNFAGPQQIYAQTQQPQLPQQPAGLTQTPPPQVSLPGTTQSAPAPHRALDVAVEDDGSSRLSQPAFTDSASHRVKVPPNDGGNKRTSSASSRSSAVASSAAARMAPYSQDRNEGAIGSSFNRPVPMPGTVQSLTNVLTGTPVKREGGERNTQVVAQQQLSSTPKASEAPPQEPKTELKKTASAFFVSLDGGSEEPRRPKPPTPCNYVPSKMFPPDAVRAAAMTAAMMKQKFAKGRKTSRSPPAANTQNRKVASAGRHVSPPVRTKATHPALHDPYAARAHNARPQRRFSPSPYGQTRRRSGDPERTQRQQAASPHTQPRPTVRARETEPQPVIATYMKTVAPMHPHFADVRKDVQGRASATTVYGNKQPVQGSSSSGSYSPYTTLTSTSSTSQPQLDKRAYNAQPSYQRLYHNAKGGKEEASHEVHYRPTSHRDHSDPNGREGVGAEGYLPQHPQLQSSQKPRKEDVSPQQHRYALNWADPSTVSFPPSTRRVPTLAELDKRLQELRMQDEYEAAQYQKRQSHLCRNAFPQQQLHTTYSSAQPQVHVLLDSPRGGVPRKLHHSRSPPMRTVSPPWRTDLNSSPLRPRWDISQPHFPVYYLPATAAGH